MKSNHKSPKTILTVAPSRRKYIANLIVSLCFVVVGMALVLDRSNASTWAGWVSIIFFGGCGLVCASQLLDLKTRIILNDDGVFDRTLNVGIIPRSELSGAYMKKIHENHFICLHLYHPGKWLNNASATQRALTATNIKLGFQPLNINLSGTSVDPELVLDIVIKKIAEHNITKNQFN